MNQSLSIDFMGDSLWDGHKFRTFNVVDDFNREALVIEVDLNLLAKRVTRALDKVGMERGYFRQLRMDNGPEFIKRGKSTKNSFIEQFKGTFRSEIFDYYVFHTLSEVGETSENWLEEYNREHLHFSLRNLTPREYREKFIAIE